MTDYGLGHVILIMIDIVLQIYGDPQCINLSNLTLQPCSANISIPSIVARQNQSISPSSNETPISRSNMWTFSLWIKMVDDQILEGLTLQRLDPSLGGTKAIRAATNANGRS